MEQQNCQKAGCTIAETGICLLSHNPPQRCPNFRQVAAPAAADGVRAVGTSPAVPSTLPKANVFNGGRRFHTGLELGVVDALEISRASYCHLFGILGASDAGKTCFLLSLYLMASRQAIPNDYLFAGSLTLKGFEDRARRLRNWKGGPLPAQLANHTSSTDARQAALLHLALRKRGPHGRRINLLLTDLPGEWSKTLVDRASTANRFEFLKRADGIILVVDGPALTSSARHVELQRTKHLLERLKDNVGVDPSIPMTILLSKGDAMGMRAPAASDELVHHALSLGFAPKAAVAAAFSYNPQIRSGEGVFEVVDRLIESTPVAASERHDATIADERRFAAFRRSAL